MDSIRFRVLVAIRESEETICFLCFAVIARWALNDMPPQLVTDA